MTFLKEHNVTDDEAGIRLDRWFKRHFPDLSHGQLQKMLRTGQIRVAGKRVEAATRLEAGQAIRVPPQAAIVPVEEIEKKAARVSDQLKRMIIYEDDDVIALNKPSGLAVQGGTGLKENLDDMMAGLAGKSGEKPKLVHRLDRDTSGVLIVARTVFAAAKLSEAFRERETQKIYWALTIGVPKLNKGQIDLPLYKDGEIMRVAESEQDEAKNAVTVYQVVESVPKQAAFVALWPVTGRTHQLRVHMAYYGTPLMGDRLYGGDKDTGLPQDELGKGLHLHARQLIIPHPRRGTIDVTAPLGPSMRQSWKWFNFDENVAVDFSKA
jgi:23S rRNA pseudouridine955/2504/2580 synthase